MSGPTTFTPATFFDKEQAESYDERFARLAPLRDTMLFLAAGALATLPADARILSVGAGTGAELLYLARIFPGWHFTAVEPAGAMLEVCRRRATEQGLAGRCVFHEGFLDSLPAGEGFHAATSILVSQFLLDPAQRSGFFREIAARLLPGGLLVNTDLSAHLGTPGYETLFRTWVHLIGDGAMPPEKAAGLQAAYGRDVAVSPPEQIAELLTAGGFAEPLPFFQGLLMRGWLAKKAG